MPIHPFKAGAAVLEDYLLDGDPIILPDKQPIMPGVMAYLLRLQDEVPIQSVAWMDGANPY